MISQQVPLDGWTIETHSEEFKPENWKDGDKIYYTGHGKAEFLAPQRNQGQWRSIEAMTYPEGRGQRLFETATKANEIAFDDLKARIDALRL
jgi:hypothetical protein